jgi:UDP-glucuronate decarboxylase
MANNGKSVLITGGCGFLGSHLSEKYLQLGYNVIVVDNFSTASRRNEEFLENLNSSSLVIVEADVIESWSSWASSINSEWLENLECLFHLASPASPPLYQNLAFETLWVNSIGLSNALSFADKHKARCIYSSTSEIYGDPEVSPQSETYRGQVNTQGPRACYDESKRFGEALLYTHNWKKKTQHGLVRIFNTYGPRMNPVDGRVVINFLVQALKGEKLSIYGDGKQTRSFCYVDDLIQGLMLYAQSSLTEPVNIGNDREFSILELAEKTRALFPEKTLELSFQDFPQDDPLQRCPDLSLAKKVLKWEPQTQIEDGLKRMLDWLKTQA